MSDEPEDTPAEKARKLLACQDGTRTDRAQAWATLAVAEAIDHRSGTSNAAGMVIEGEPIFGTVIDSGGGEIRVLVARDTVNYPGVNTEVELRVR